jgi:hypothetical protein
VDAGVENVQELMTGIVSGCIVRPIQIGQDGIAQITSALQQVDNPVQSLHLISHGAPGAIFVGNRVLTAETLPEYTAEIGRWQEFLTHDAEILIYGCSVAATAVGNSLLQQLHHLTGAILAASSTPVGHLSKGGNWQLDYVLTAAHRSAPDVAIASSTQREWTGVLATQTSNLTNPSVLGDPILAGQAIATSFTTGSDTYTLNSIALITGDTFPSDSQVQIYTNSGGTPGDLLTTLTHPTSVVTNETNIFSDPNQTELSANTVYHVVVSSVSAPTEVSLTADTSETGWAIENHVDAFAGVWLDGASGPTANAVPLQFEIDADVVTPTNAPPTLNATSVVISGTTEDTTFEIPDASIFANVVPFDSDGTVEGLLVQSVASAGTLRIGGGPEEAQPWEAGVNDEIRNGEIAFWTPAENVNGEAVPAFVVAAIDNEGAISTESALIAVEVSAENDAPFIGAQPTVLYDTASGLIPSDTSIPPSEQVFALGNIDTSNVPTFAGNATAIFAGGVTQLDTTGNNTSADNATYAGYSNYAAEGNVPITFQPVNPATLPDLDRTEGYIVSFDLKVNETVDDDLGSDKNLDGLPDRAGFSMIAISSDGQYGIELGFGTNSIWALEDGTGQSNPSLEPEPTDGGTSDRTLFTQAESAQFTTNNSLVSYDLLVQGSAYTLYADGASILTGRLRDYTALEGLIDPYEQPNFLFFGDNTPSARGRVDLGDIAIANLADNASYSSTFDEAIDQGSAAASGVPVFADLSLADIDTDAIASATIMLTNGAGDAGERLLLTETFANVDYALVSDTEITVSNLGGATVASMAEAIAAIRYQNNDAGPTERDRTVTLDVSDGVTSSQISATVAVVADGDVPTMSTVLINEIDPNTPSTDAAEFVELYDGGTGNTSLDGLVLVFFNGNGNTSYAAFDLNGFSTDADGYFVLGNAAVANVDVTFSDNTLQNGTDAVALYLGTAADFPNNTPVTTTNLLDAIVYGSAANTELLTLLNGDQLQVDENVNGQETTQSLQRFPNGSGDQRNTDSMIAGTPSPGVANVATVEFASSTFTVSEAVGTSSVVELTRSQSSGESSVVVSVSTGTATVTDDYDGTRFPLTVTFADGETSQLVDIPLVNDSTVEGDETIGLTLSTPDGAFVGPQATATLTITDDDTAGFAVTETATTTVNETGTLTDSLSVVLTAQPLTDVTLAIAIDDPSEVAVSTPSLTFTPDNWNQSQSVTVTGVDDVSLDGDQTSIITVSVNAAASDDAFDSLASQSVSVTTVDDDGASFTITESEGTTAVEESGTTDSFTVVLDRQPLTDVQLTVASSDMGEAIAETATLIFTSATWDVPQTVTVTGIDDDVADGSQTSTIEVSVDTANSDATFDTVTPQTVLVTTADNDTPGVGVTQTDGTTTVAEGGTGDTYAVALNSEPTGDVTITLTPDAQLTLDTTTLVFSSATWDVAQTITVTAVDDDVFEGAHSGTIRQTVTSSDGNYQDITIPDITVAITDNDVAAIAVTESDGTTAVAEGGANDSYEIVLTAIPTADVVITLEAPDGETILSPPTLTFTSATWNLAQTVTVTATDDELIEGSHTSTITHTAASDDPDFNGFAIADVTVAVTDNDAPGFSITESEAATRVDESGTTDTFEVMLDRRPISDVALTVVSGNEDEAIAAPTTLTFTTDNWDTPQTVTVTGQDDETVDGSQTSTITVSVDAAASDAAFATVMAQSVSVTTTDDDIASFSVAESDGDTTVDETGTTDTFSVVLDQQPLTDVVFTVASSDDSAATVAPMILTFTSSSWNVPQTVTVTGVDDDIADGEQATTLTVTVADGSDAAFVALAAQSLTVTTTDDDVVGVTVVESDDGTAVTEGNGIDSYTVQLDTQPTATVFIALNTDGETTLNTSTLSFTPEMWNTPQTVTVTAVDDDVVEGPHTSTITHNVSSADPNYDDFAVPSIPVDITDNDSIGVTVVESNDITEVSEEGVTDGYTVVLNSQPTATVTVTLIPDAQVTLDQTALSFTPITWNQPQTVVVAAVNDPVAEGEHTGIVSHITSSSDADYDGFAIDDVTANITDNDMAGVTITESNDSTLVTEAGDTDGYSLVLTSQPTDVVTVEVLADEQTAVSTATVVFTPDDWNIPQNVTVGAIDDLVIEGPHEGTIAHVVTSDDLQYSTIAASDVVASITDNEVAGFVLSTATSTISEAGAVGGAIAVTLTGEPLSPVVLEIDNPDAGEVSLSTTTVTLDSSNWDTGVEVMFQGPNDNVVDGDQITSLSLSVVDASSDNAFDSLPDQTITITTLDTNTAEVALPGTMTITVTEGGDPATFALALTSIPAAEVELTFDGGNQLVTPEPLTFTPETWNVPQIVTLAAIADDVFESDHTGTLSVTVSSDDPNFEGIVVDPITVAIADPFPSNLIFPFEQFVTFQAIDEGVNPTFDEDLYLLANPDVAAAVQRGEISSGAVHYNQFGIAEGRPILPLSLEIGGLNMADFFDETFYLDQHPDVREVVAQGSLANGFEHFLRFGLAEGRNPSAYYDEAFYRATNPDIVDAIDNGSLSSGLAHFVQTGHLENRDPSALFDADDYLVNNPDVQTAIDNGTILSAFEHFLEFGASESRLPVLLFEEQTYLANNADVADVVANTPDTSGFIHYVTFGQLEGRDPSVSFDESAYLMANPDVATVVGNGGLSSGMEHYFRFGRAEERPLV